MMVVDPSQLYCSPLVEYEKRGCAVTRGPAPPAFWLPLSRALDVGSGREPHARTQRAPGGDDGLESVARALQS